LSGVQTSRLNPWDREHPENWLFPVYYESLIHIVDNLENAVFRIGMLTDYGIVILTQIASSPEKWSSATDIATALVMPIHTVAKVLKTLHQGGFLESRRGKQGGYRLAKSPREISVRAIFEAFEGQLRVTECAIPSDPCQLSSKCHMARHWRVINEVIRRTLDDISLEFLLQPEPVGWVGFVGRSSNLERDCKRLPVRLIQAITAESSTGSK